ncbi:MAG TPA: SDR family NAD(P)-dependent oxidoreductase [Stellaceae bacterium]|jgi:NAD(P)-dependent dehydrogenase (short-subunit alcohol dehydrogenase family)|nr:SDR family NAD(P)-dependent oxidoreductase [Stellaceae bacterium]
MKAQGKTILITGATDGVGRRVALDLGEAGARLLIHGRDRDRAEVLIDELARHGNRDVRFYRADLASLAEVRGLAEAVRRDEKRLDVVISNAGIGTAVGGRERSLSADGHELRFAVNYLAGFLLVRLLLPLLRAATPSRVVNVASAGQTPIDFDDVMLERDYTGGRAYMQSKLAQIMFTFDLARELEDSGVTANALHPATYMNTTMVRQSGATPISTVEEGAAAICRLAVSPEVEGKTGLYFDRMQATRANAQAYDERARDRLRRLSYELTGLKPE